MPFIPTICPQPNRTTTSVTNNFLLSSWLWRNGDSGWRGLRSRFRSGLTIRTSSTSRLPRGSTHAKHDGPDSSPGSTSTLPTTLSQYFKGPVKDPTPDTIRRPEVFVHAVEMDIEREICQALDGETAPSSCPDGRLYVPAPVWSQVLQWGHSSRFSGHPSTGRTLSFLQRKFWWPAMREDVLNFVYACSICAQFKVTHQPPQGLLQPLPIPYRLWSHIALDFVTFTHFQSQHYHPHHY